MRRTLLVGLDGLSWDYLDPLLAANQLPHLSSLISMGTYGETISTLPAQTPTAWASIITGKNPGKHGVFDFRQPNSAGDGIVVPNSTTRIGTPFWSYLNNEGVRVGLVNVPLTHPPEAVDGFVVCGFGAPASSSDVTFPEQAKEWIAADYGPYKPHLTRADLAGLDYSDQLEAMAQHELTQIRIATQGARTYGTHVLCVNLMLFDYANHKMPEMRMVTRAIEIMDAHLGLLMDWFSPDTVLAFSDHGSRRISGDFLLDLWLRDRGHIDGLRTRRSEKSQALNFILQSYLEEAGSVTGIRQKLYRAALREAMLRLPDSLVESSWERISKRYPLSREFFRFANTADRDRSEVYALSAWSGLLYLNGSRWKGAGVDRKFGGDGPIDQLADDLQSIEYSNKGERLISSVYRPSALYDGPAVAQAPSLILDHYSSPWNVSLAPLGLYSHEEVLSRYLVRNSATFGVHRRDGVFVFAGADIARGKVNEALALVDLPATLLYLYQLPIPEDFDGLIATNSIASEFAETHEPLSGTADLDERSHDLAAYTDEERQQVEDHLRMLGYLE